MKYQYLCVLTFEEEGGVLGDDTDIQMDNSILEFGVPNKANSLVIALVMIKHEIGTGLSPTKQDESEESKEGKVEFFKEDNDGIGPQR